MTAPILQCELVDQLQRPQHAALRPFISHDADQCEIIRQSTSSAARPSVSEGFSPHPPHRVIGYSQRLNVCSSLCEFSLVWGKITKLKPKHYVGLNVKITDFLIHVDIIL